MTTEAATPDVATPETTMPVDAPIVPSVPALPPLAFAMRVSLEVSSNFIDLDGLACLRCGAPFAQSRLSNRRAIVRDTHGDFLDCRTCQVRYYARGGRFIEHGAFNQKRWCAQCQEWRPSGLEGCVGEIQACHVCLSEFDGDGPLPAEYAALQTIKARLAAQAEGAELASAAGNATAQEEHRS